MQQVVFRLGGVAKSAGSAVGSVGIRLMSNFRNSPKHVGRGVQQWLGNRGGSDGIRAWVLSKSSEIARIVDEHGAGSVQDSERTEQVCNGVRFMQSHTLSVKMRRHLGAAHSTS